MTKAPPRSQSDIFLRPPVFPEPPRQASWDLKLWHLEDGSPFDPAAFKGKTVVLNFWATWCDPCRREMPQLQRLYDKTRADGIVFAAISEEPNVQVRKFVTSGGYTLPFLHMSEKAPDVFRTPGIPATFIVSADGRIAFKHVGAAKWDDETTLTFLRSLPQGKP
jgi:thiol-disulfide isomerase/thioredoxin